MKKCIFTLMLIFAMSLNMIACGNANAPAAPKETQHQETQKPEVKETRANTRPASDYDDSTPEGIIAGIEGDFADTITFLQEKFDETNAAIGTTYEDYLENKQILTDWYDFVLAEETALFERTKERAIDYFKCIASSIDHEDYNAMNDAMDEFYDQIYDGAMDDFYDDVYDDLMDDAYDTYYDGIVEDGYDVDPYAKWSSESSECYKAWSAASSDIYKCWSAASSTLYQYWSAVSSGFYRDDYDVDAIIAERERERAEAAAQAEAAKETETTEETEIAEESDVTEAPKITETTATTETASDNSGGIRPEFKEAMDSYEAFFDEYIEFMTEYANADATDLLEMLADYTEYMKQYVETMKEFEDLGNQDLSTEEALYYAEVSSRISRKLLEVEY